MKPLNQATILIVDDTEENLQILVEALADSYEVAVATDGETALEAVNENKPDIILLDVVMPGIDGYEVCSRLKKQQETADIPVIFLTARIDVRDKTRGLALGAVDYITKPFEISEVRARVHTHLSIYLMSLELQEQRRIADANSRAKAEFLTTMSHEIRTPMNGILGMAQLLLETPLTNKQRNFAQTIFDSGSSLLAIINDILDHSKLEAGKMTLESIAFSPAKLLESAKNLMNNRATEKGLEIIINISENTPETILGDLNRIRQLLLNFLSNALKFTDKGHIKLNLRPAGKDRLYFSVEDTGIGINDEDTQKLFKDFSQVDSSISRKYGGTGLGLSICKKIIEIMQGEIGVKSTLGHGSEFWFEINAIATTQPAAEITDPKDNFTGKLPRLSILLAEDNKVNQKVIIGMLTKSRHDISVANNGFEAIHACDEHMYDVVLMDIQMPDMNGIQATRQIRELSSSNSQVPIIAITANIMDEDRERCLTAGMNGFIKKPVDPMLLNAEIAKVLNISSQNNPTHKAPLSYHYLNSERITTLEQAVSRRDLIALFKEFFTNISLELNTIQEALSSYDLETLTQTAHKIKGASANLGLPVIAREAELLEKSSLSNSQSECNQLIAEISAAVTETHAEVKKFFPDIHTLTPPAEIKKLPDLLFIEKLEEYLRIIELAIKAKSIEQYEDAANFFLTLELPEDWQNELRRIDMLVFGEKFDDAEILIEELLNNLITLGKEQKPENLQGKLEDLYSALVYSKPKDIANAVSVLQHQDVPQEITDEVAVILNNVKHYQYRHAIGLLADIIGKLTSGKSNIS